MTEPPAGQGADHWKQKYYDQLDRLDRKEEEWSRLEALLKRTVGRLSLAAEGQNKTIDRYMRDIRTAVRDKINQQQLDSILDDLTNLLAKMEEKQGAQDKQIVVSLQMLLESLALPSQCDKPRKKLIKHLAKASDEDRDRLIDELRDLLKLAIGARGAVESRPQKSSLLDRLLGTTESTEKKTERSLPEDPLKSDFTDCIRRLNRLINWPAETRPSVAAFEAALTGGHDDTKLQRLAQLINEHMEVLPPAAGGETAESADSYRQCLLSIINGMDNPVSPNGRLAAFRTLVYEAAEQQQLHELSVDLTELLKSFSSLPDTAGPALAVDTDSQPSVQELLIRLLEQLLVPADLTDAVDEMKTRLESETNPAGWSGLLKDVASLINSIRSRMQQEKHEFEDFLQQITGRLNEMDEFLRIESDSIQDAGKHGRAFDEQIHGHVQNIRDDVIQATDLNHLKTAVENRLDVISQHIREYRLAEDYRLEEAQQNVEHMQSRVVSLEHEAQSLKKILVEKNKQAMFDALTGVPNRLAYEKKAIEEIARCKRFGNPLSLAIWDVDYFKKVNDTFGHKAGDKVLRTIAQLLNERIRETDFLARYGGEEFVMLLPGTKEEETLRLVNDLRERVANCGFHYHGDPVSITVSCGVSGFSGDDTLDQVFERADQALYRAKRNGRNQCVVASCLSD